MPIHYESLDSPSTKTYGEGIEAGELADILRERQPSVLTFFQQAENLISVLANRGFTIRSLSPTRSGQEKG
jgi:hypothetical protein